MIPGLGIKKRYILTGREINGTRSFVLGIIIWRDRSPCARDGQYLTVSGVACLDRKKSLIEKYGQNLNSHETDSQHTNSGKKVLGGG